MRYARMLDGKAVTIEEFDDIESQLTEEVRSLYLEAPDGVELGHYYNNGSWIGAKPSEFHEIVSGSWVENTTRKNQELQKRTVEAGLTQLRINRQFGVDLIDTFAIENVSLGITGEQSDIVMSALLPTLTALSNGYLETATRRIREINPLLFDGTFLSESRILSYLNRIEAHLGLPLSTEL